MNTRFVKLGLFSAGLTAVCGLLLAGCGGGDGRGQSNTPNVAVIGSEVAGDTSLAPQMPHADVIAILTHPVSGDLSVNSAAPFTWNGIAGVDSYRLIVGTGPTQSDLFDSGELASSVNSISVTALPANAVLYARLFTRAGGVWRFSDVVFSSGAVADAAEMIEPVDGARTFLAGRGFRWTTSAIARSYSLKIGSAAGLSDVYNGITMRSTRHFVSSLPIGKQLFGKLTTNYFDGTSAYRSFTFTTSDSAIRTSDQLDAVLWATGQVRQMASSINQPFPNTNLANLVQLADESSAACTDFAAALMDFLKLDVGLGIQTRLQNVCLNPNQYDCHTLVEVQNPDTKNWMMVDPTFGLIAKRASDGAYATAFELSDASRAQNWSSIRYEFLTDAGDTHARAYYMDYPLFFVNVYGSGSIATSLTTPVAISAFYSPVPAFPTSGFESYAIQCSSGVTSVDLIIDGSAARIECADGRDGISHIFLAVSISPAVGVDPSSFQLLKPIRNVF